MSNDLSKSPLYIDTVGVVMTDKIMVRGLRWCGASTAGHKCTIKDNDGRIVWASYAPGANHVDPDRPEEVWNGMNVTDLDSGYLLVSV